MTDDDLWFAPIRQQDHADRRIAERVGRVDVAGEIRLGLLFGRFTATRPRWLDDRAPRPERFRVLYVWDETLTRCWVLRRSANCLYPVTVLLEKNVWRGLAEQRRNLRAGGVRA